MLSVSIETVLSRIQKGWDRHPEPRPYITIDPSTFKDVRTKCTFIDAEHGEWQATPDNVMRGGMHPERRRSVPHLISPEGYHELYIVQNLSLKELAKKLNCSASRIFKEIRECGLIKTNRFPFQSDATRAKAQQARKKFTIETLRERLKERFGDLVWLASSQTYTKMIEPMVFVDRDYGEWSATPNDVINKGCTHPTRKLEKRKSTNLATTGFDNPFRDTKKIRAAMKAKHGVEHPSQSPELLAKAQQSILERYGAKCVLSLPEFQERIRLTMLERYGVEHSMQNAAIRGHMIETMRERYHVDSAQQCPEIREKTARTNLERYNGVAPACSPEVREKIRATNLERYDGVAPMCSEVVRQSSANTCLARYKVDNAFKSETIKEKIKHVLMERYDVEHPIHSPLIRARMEQTCRKRYNAASPLESIEILRKTRQSSHVVSKLEIRAARLLGLEHFRTTPIETDLRRCPDFRLGERVYLDVDGLYWHSSTKAAPDHHVRKRIEYERAELRLIQIRDHEIRLKPQVVSSLLAKYQGRPLTRVCADDCDVLHPSWEVAEAFFQQHHLHGAGESAKAFALCRNGDIAVALAVRALDTGIEITRFCSANLCSVEGGFATLLNVAVQHLRPAFALAFCDLRYSTGRTFTAAGFVAQPDVQGWAWTDYREVYDAAQKPKPKWVKIYDAGQRPFLLTF